MTVSPSGICSGMRFNLTALFSLAQSPAHAKVLAQKNPAQIDELFAIEI
jgi:hypothetical protein